MAFDAGVFGWVLRGNTWRLRGRARMLGQRLTGLSVASGARAIDARFNGFLVQLEIDMLHNQRFTGCLSRQTDQPAVGIEAKPMNGIRW